MADESIQNMIYEIRGQKVMLDRDLAGLYGAELKALNQATKRNIERFPTDFMFQLTQDEWDILRSQIVTANKNISKVRYLPYAFMGKDSNGEICFGDLMLLPLTMKATALTLNMVLSYLGRTNMGIDNEERFLRMTRTEVLEVAHALNQEFDANEEDSGTFFEYIETLEGGEEMLKNHPGYYPYMKKETE